MNKYKSLFEKVAAEHASSLQNYVPMTRNSVVLVVDGTHSFIRAWSVVPTLTDNGEHCGGISGFLTSLGYAIKLLRPTRVIVVFDGKGGSARRRALYPDYKNKRAMKIRVNRAYEELSNGVDEMKAMTQQLLSLAGNFLPCLPVSVISIDHIEADDAIAYIANSVFSKPENRVIVMSGDRDFIQIVNDRVTLWSPIKKKIYSVQDVVNEYGIHPINFPYYRMLEGDNSDNITGVKGIGRKTAIKRFPMLTEATETSVEKVLEFAKDKANEQAVYQHVVDQADIVARNYMLMQLKDPDFSPSLQMQISEAVNRTNDYNKFLFIQLLTKHGMHSAIPNYHVWLQEVFYPLSCFTK